MRYPIKILLLLSLFVAALSPALANAVDEGAAAFAKGDFAAATRAYETALAAGPKSAALYYNLGMAQWKDGQFPQAAANFRRSLALDARFVDARIALNNLERSQGLPVQNPNWQTRLAERAPLGLMLGTGSVLAWLGAFLLLGSFFKQHKKLRAFVAGVALLVVGLAVFGAAYLSDPLISEKRAGIVVAKGGITLLAAPADQSAAVTKVPMCGAVQILKRSGEWTFCATPANGRGWVESAKIEAILPQT